MVHFIVKIGHETQYSLQEPVTNNFLLKVWEFPQVGVETR